MGLVTSIPLLLFLVFWMPPLVRAQLPPSSLSAALTLNALLQDYAYRAFVRPRTGVAYDVTLPANLSGIKVSAMRLRSGSLRTRGVSLFKEFHIPVGVVQQPYVERLVLVYHNLGNWSTLYYPLPGYMYLTPVLGLLAYDASDLSAKNLPELEIRASAWPMSVKFSDLKPMPRGSVPRCVSFDLHGSVNFTNLLPDNICPTFKQGHFSVVVESIAPSPAPPLSPLPAEAPEQAPLPSGEQKNNNSKIWIIIVSVIGGFAMLVLLGLLVLWVHKYKQSRKMQQMEKAADVGEPLHMATVRSTKAPAAAVTRTQPSLETEYVP